MEGEVWVTNSHRDKTYRGQQGVDDIQVMKEEDNDEKPNPNPGLRQRRTPDDSPNVTASVGGKLFSAGNIVIKRFSWS